MCAWPLASHANSLAVSNLQLTRILSANDSAVSLMYKNLWKLSFIFWHLIGPFQIGTKRALSTNSVIMHNEAVIPWYRSGKSDLRSLGNHYTHLICTRLGGVILNRATAFVFWKCALPSCQSALRVLSKNAVHILKCCLWPELEALGLIRGLIRKK